MMIKTIIKTRSLLKHLLLGVLIWSPLYFFQAQAQAQAPSSQLASHDLQCGDVFYCPPELARRVDFWIQVFRLWKIEDRVFHDSRVPERVYSVINTSDQCRRRNPKGKVKREITQIKSQLKTIADQLEKGVDPEQVRSLPLANLFDQLSVKELRDAADNIRCQSGNRERFKKALENFELYRPFIVQSLIDQKLSTELQYLPFVESSFNPKAYSHAGAAGLWQIMPSTARSLGLQVGSSVDERFEPELATLAAAKYFRNSTKKLTAAANAINASVAPVDLNPFIVTSYNYGVRGMERAIAQVGTDYIKLLAEYKSNSFRTAVRNFYASFLAARYVAKNSALYFPQITSNKKQQSQSIAIKKATRMKEIEKIVNVKRATLRSLNPALTSRVWKGTRAVPAGYVFKVPLKNHDWSSQSARIDKLPVLAGGDSGQRHKVRRGQTACGIANKYQVKCRDLIVLNKLNRKAVIRIGQRLKIPTSGREKYRPGKLAKKASIQKVSAQSQNQSTKNQSTQSNVAKKAATKKVTRPVAGNAKINYSLSLNETNKGISLRVLASETLGHYADWMGGGSSAEIRRLNGLKKSNHLSFGRLIKLPKMSASQKAAFEAQRENFHEAIAVQYFQHFKVKGTTNHRIREGESLWRLTQNAGVPLWLLHNYNPNMRQSKVGSKIVIPEIESL